MDLNLIKKLVKLVGTSDITDLEIEENGVRIKVAKKIRSAKVAGFPQNFTAQMPAEVSVSNVIANEEKQSSVSAVEQAEKLHEVRSPIVGTFYRSPAPDADPYVQVGDTVVKGTVLCIVEAMKLMNEIESDVDGKIVKILVDNGKPVEYNQPLFLIQPS